MELYKYLCNFCGEIEKSVHFSGMRKICGKCKRSMILLDAYHLPKR